MTKQISAGEFDRIFDEGEEDIMEYLDLENAVLMQGDAVIKRVNVDFPQWMVDELDQEASRLSINRQAVIKTWIAGVIDQRRLDAARYAALQSAKTGGASGAA